MPNDTKTLLTGSPEWQQHCIDHLELCPNCDTKSRIAVEQDNLMSASDGSAPHHGSFAWALADNHTRETLATGGGECQHFDGLTSHRMETAGRLGRDMFLAATQQQCTHFRLPANTSPMPHFCDNKESVNRSNEPPLPHLIKHTLHDCDLHDAIRELRHNVPATTATWIKGHQDKDTPLEKLTFSAQLNVLTDQLAEQFQSDNPAFLPAPPVPQLRHNNIPITQKLDKFMHFHSGEDALRQRTLRKHPDWTDDTFDDISWKPIGRVLKRLQPCR